MGEGKKWRNKKSYIERKGVRKDGRKPRINLEATNRITERNKYETIDEWKEGREEVETKEYREHVKEKEGKK